MQDERRDDVAVVDVAVALSESRETALSVDVRTLLQRIFLCVRLLSTEEDTSTNTNRRSGVAGF